MHRRPQIASAIRFFTVLAVTLSGAHAVAMPASLAKTASWGPERPASGRFGDAPTAEPESIRIGEAWSYESALGRIAWLSRDPIGEEGGLNLYGYVGNNPVRNTDPKGTNGIAIGIGVLIIAIALATACQHEQHLAKKRDEIPPEQMKEYEKTMDPNGQPSAHANEAVNQSMPEIKEHAFGIGESIPGTMPAGPVDVPLEAHELIPTLWNKLMEHFNKPKDDKPEKPNESCPKQ